MTQSDLFDPPARRDDPESSHVREYPAKRRDRVVQLHVEAGGPGTTRPRVDERLTFIEGKLVTEGMTSPIIGQLINEGVLFRLKQDGGRWTVHRSYRHLYQDAQVLREGPRWVSCPHCGESWPAVKPK